MTTELSLDEWIRFVFAHPVTDPAWHFDIDAPYHELRASRSAELIAETFERAGELLQPFTDAQLNQGFRLLVSSGSSDYMFCLTDASVPWPLAAARCPVGSRPTTRADSCRGTRGPRRAAGHPARCVQGERAAWPRPPGPVPSGSGAGDRCVPVVPGRPASRAARLREASENRPRLVAASTSRGRRPPAGVTGRGARPRHGAMVGARARPQLDRAGPEDVGGSRARRLLLEHQAAGRLRAHGPLRKGGVWSQFRLLSRISRIPTTRNQINGGKLATTAGPHPPAL